MRSKHADIIQYGGYKDEGKKQKSQCGTVEKICFMFFFKLYSDEYSLKQLYRKIVCDEVSLEQCGLKTFWVTVRRAGKSKICVK